MIVCVDHALRDHPEVVADLGATTFCDVRACNALLALPRHAENFGGRL